MRCLAVFLLLANLTPTKGSIFACQSYDISPPITNLCQFMVINDATCSYSQFSSCKYYSKCQVFQGSMCLQFETVQDRNLTKCLMKCCPYLQTENSILYSSFNCESTRNGQSGLDPFFHQVNVEVFIAIVTILSFLFFLVLFIRKCKHQPRQMANNHQNIENPPSQRAMNNLPKGNANAVDKKWIPIQAKNILSQLLQENCSICLINKPNCLTQCRHYFHRSCIAQWMQMKNNCPLCKTQNLTIISVFCEKCLKCYYECKVSQIENSKEDYVCKNCKE